MDHNEIQPALEKQKAFFASGTTLDVEYRLSVLKQIRSLILLHEEEIRAALWTDFHKPLFEVIATETRFVLKELNWTIRNLKRWARVRKVRTPLIHFLSHSFITYQPYGQVLILSPWNYPFQLAFVPMIGAIAAGNCVVMKTSRQVPACNSVIRKIIDKLPPELVLLVEGDHSVSEFLLDYSFDYIFFTGSTRIGMHVMQKASEKLIPVSLELGGKNPCVVAADAKLDLAARRIAWGKFLNAGQTCICTDYLVVDRRIKDEFLKLLVKEIKSFYGKDASESDSFARMINCKSAERISELIDPGKVLTGGNVDAEKCYVEPTVLINIKDDDEIMQEEVFGPVLPVLDFGRFDEVYEIIEKNPRPLAVYLFSRDRKLQNEFLSRTRSGTASINDTVVQIASPYLPYGGVGNSGMGKYHGRASFVTFSNTRSLIKKSNLIDIKLRYPPYTKFKEKALKFLFR